MADKLRKADKTLQAVEGTCAGTGLDAVEELETREVLQRGIASVAGAVRFSIAAASDMLNGRLTPQEASVCNTTAGRILKGAELYLKKARGRNKDLTIPCIDDK